MPRSLGMQRRIIQLVVLCVFLPACAGDKGSAEPITTDQRVARLGLSRIFPTLEFEQPVAMIQAPVDGQHWYIVEKPGRIIRVALNEAGTSKHVYLDISDRVDNDYNEGGLLGMAFHPGYPKVPYVYVSYTRSGSPLISQISRFKALPSAQSVDVQSEKKMLSVKQPYSNHNGGQIAFARDGYLYIGLGDGGSGGDPQRNGQNLGTLLGAILRIDVDKGDPYTVPEDNPFVENQTAAKEIYAYGMRNPWRWSFDSDTGKLWVADVGQNQWEEVNVVEKGGNYGWNIREGRHCYSDDQCSKAHLIDPVAEYSHEYGCSITGGYVYRGKKIQALTGYYLMGDFCSGAIWALNTENVAAGSTLVINSDLNISSFAQSNDGELYVVDLGGRLFQIIQK